VAASTYVPLVTVNQPGGSQIVDRNLTAIKSALDALAQSEPNPAVVTKNADYPLTPSDTYVLMRPDASATLTAALPAPDKTKGRVIFVKNIGPGGTTVNVIAPKATIDGTSTKALASMDAVQVLSDGTSYWIL
jgi:hypothetical protein